MKHMFGHNAARVLDLGSQWNIWSLQSCNRIMQQRILKGENAGFKGESQGRNSQFSLESLIQQPQIHGPPSGSRKYAKHTVEQATSSHKAQVIFKTSRKSYYA